MSTGPTSGNKTWHGMSRPKNFNQLMDYTNMVFRDSMIKNENKLQQKLLQEQNSLL